MKITVVHTKRSKFTNTVYVGRPSALGNPFSHLNLKHTIKVASVEDAVERYAEWLDARIKDTYNVRDALDHIIDVAEEHNNEVYLACWCKDEVHPNTSDHQCHADVIRSVILNHLNNAN